MAKPLKENKSCSEYVSARAPPGSSIKHSSRYRIKTLNILLSYPNFILTPLEDSQEEKNIKPFLLCLIFNKRNNKKNPPYIAFDKSRIIVQKKRLFTRRF
ncbi:hypothetical protein [Janthinobacterium sp. B9-8]|uniref:hypothetical protein n=1 Tax=Janthinobacterium sp. B9-8 TaxID=1236179 RepID=UPI0012E36CF8|nr:hypothetical protein [Janthinobacterium sp. B9-8]